MRRLSAARTCCCSSPRHSPLAAWPAARIRAVVATHDENGDGCLDRSEWIAALTAEAKVREAAVRAEDEQRRAAEDEQRRAAEEAEESLERQGERAEAAANQQVWEDAIPTLFETVWEGRKKQPGVLRKDEAWRTIELRRDGVCRMQEGTGPKTTSKKKLQWEVLSNSDFWKSEDDGIDHRGALAIVSERGSKPFHYFSRERFQREYPVERDASLHPGETPKKKGGGRAR